MIIYRPCLSTYFRWLFACLFLNPAGFVYAQDSGTVEWRNKLHQHLLLDPADSPIKFDERGIVVYDTLGTAEASFSYSELKKLSQHLKSNPADTSWYSKKEFVKTRNFNIPGPPKFKNRPLEGWKIAIDPGHISENLKDAKLEKKYVELAGSPGKHLIEGRLNLATAFIIRDSLTKLGAEVLLTRERAESAEGFSFEEWKKKRMDEQIRQRVREKRLSPEEANYLKFKSTEREKFIFFNNLDLETRSRLINDFMPNLVLIIHYNVDFENEPWTSLTERNYSMTFIPGAFSSSELKERRDRIELLRLMISDTWENSANLSNEVQTCFVSKLGVPSAKQNEIPYLLNYTNPTSFDGVFSRNLSMTRLIKFPMVYGEPLYQDNKREFNALSRIDGWVGNETWNVRIKQVADCYIRGVLNYSARE